MVYQKKEKPRGGKVLLQRDIYFDQHEKLVEISDETGYSIAFLTREAIDLLILKYKK